jgi:tellurite resistance protein
MGMFPLLRTRARRRRASFVLIERLTPETIAGFATAGAIMAWADGRIDRAERLAWLGFLREQGVLAYASRRAMLDAFDEATAKLDSRPLAELCEAADGLSRLAGTSGAQLVGMAASRVALADGIAWPQETAVLQVIRDRLGLAPKRQQEAC